MDDMTPAPISVDRLRELLDKATPGPWTANGPEVLPPSSCGEVECCGIAECHHGSRQEDAYANANLIAEGINALPILMEQLIDSREELSELRQACWEARALLGFDNDGDPTPDALLYPSLADLVRRDAAEFRKDYDEARNEAHAAEAVTEEMIDRAFEAFHLAPLYRSERERIRATLEYALTPPSAKGEL